jgi:hypothetical protein
LGYLSDEIGWFFVSNRVYLSGISMGGSGSLGIGMRRRGEVRIDLCATDEFGDHATENKIHVHDLHTTILHQLGIDHKRLTFRSQGRDF